MHALCRTQYSCCGGKFATSETRTTTKDKDSKTYLSCCVSVASRAVGGVDYGIRPNIAPGSTVTFAANEGTVDCEIDITPDTVREAAETFEVKVATTGTGWVLATRDTTTVTIEDDEGWLDCVIRPHQPGS